MTDFGLVPVAQPDESAVQLDVVFVHGLTGHRTTSWTIDPVQCREPRPFWPEWLAKDVATAKVWTYGYNAAAFAKASADNLTIHAEMFLKALVDSGVGKRKKVSEAGSDSRKIVFIGHSLGGIMIKLIMVKAFQPGQEYSYLFNSSTAVIFLGSPHRGSIWANRLYNLQRWMPSRRDENFVKLLRADSSSPLVDIGAQFNSCWNSKPVYTVREKNPRMGISVVVKLEDAITHCQNEEIIDVDRDHRSIAKPLSREDVVYKFVVERLALNVSDATSNTESFQAKASVPKLLPIPNEKSPRRGKPNWFRLYFSNPSVDNDVTRPLQWESLEDGLRSADEIANDYAFGKTFTARYEFYTGATIVLEPDAEDWSLMKWSIFTPMSLFYPGKHYGRLKFPDDFPYKPPKVIWESPLASPYVSASGRISTTGELENDWSPVLRSLDLIMVNLTALVVYGPGFYGHKDAIGGAYVPWHFHRVSLRCRDMLPKISDTTFAEALPPDWVIVVTNFFSRHFNSLDEEELFDPDPLTQITRAHAEQSVAAIDACIKALQSVPNGRGTADANRCLLALGDYRSVFDRLEEFGEWRREEQRCAKILAPPLEVIKS